MMNTQAVTSYLTLPMLGERLKLAFSDITQGYRFTSLIDYSIIIAYPFLVMTFIVPTKDLDSLQFN